MLHPSHTSPPPTERSVNSPERRGKRGGSAGRGKWSCVDRCEGGRKLEGEDVASESEEAKVACRSWVDSSLAVLRVRLLKICSWNLSGGTLHRHNEQHYFADPCVFTTPFFATIWFLLNLYFTVFMLPSSYQKFSFGRQLFLPNSLM
jgi:hypothetical protein